MIHEFIQALSPSCTTAMPPAPEDRPQDVRPRNVRPISNELFGMLLFLIVETMFFAGLIGAYIVLRKGAGSWRPEVLNDMVSGLSIGNTVVLCLSGLTMLLATVAVRREDATGLRLFLGLSCALGFFFVVGQGVEFARLLKLVPMGGNIFGSVFYTFVSVHALHVLGGALWLILVTVRAFKGRYLPYRATAVHLSALYWYFVVFVWLFLYAALYLL